LRWINVYNAMDDASLTAIVEAARRHGMRVCGHAVCVPPGRAAVLGQATIEHAIDFPRSCLRDGAVEPEHADFADKVTWGWRHFDPEKGGALLRLFLEHGIGWVPTLVVQDAIACCPATPCTANWSCSSPRAARRRWRRCRWRR
jgi:hypothetical protein